MRCWWVPNPTTPRPRVRRTIRRLVAAKVATAAKVAAGGGMLVCVAAAAPVLYDRLMEGPLPITPGGDRVQARGLSHPEPEYGQLFRPDWAGQGYAVPRGGGLGGGGDHHRSGPEVASPGDAPIAIPEPGTLLLFLAGALALGLVRLVATKRHT